MNAFARASVLTTVALWCAPGYSACLLSSYTTADELARSHYVVVGEVQSERAADTRGHGPGVTIYSVRIVEAVKGSPAKVVSVYSENSSGRFPMRVGGRYVLFLDEEPLEGVSGQVLTADNCGKSGPLPEAAATLKEVKKMSRHLTARSSGP